MWNSGLSPGMDSRLFPAGRPVKTRGKRGFCIRPCLVVWRTRVDAITTLQHYTLSTTPTSSKVNVNRHTRLNLYTTAAGCSQLNDCQTLRWHVLDIIARTSTRVGDRAFMSLYQVRDTFIVIDIRPTLLQFCPASKTLLLRDAMQSVCLSQ